MKLATLGLIIALALPPVSQVQANEPPQDMCREMGEIAEMIMQIRQTGAPMSELIGIAEGNDLLMGMILDAYNQPIYTTEEYQQRAVRNFRNDMEAFCYRVLMG